ncbi:MAG: hypothetical protein IBX50_11195 [Marinospirillum sp.]|nr:hypothetical protein [Marinospirillum sp.]MBE0507263.1 hypothetical protein [Marinospirillum sp.]
MLTLAMAYLHKIKAGGEFKPLFLYFATFALDFSIIVTINDAVTALKGC